jgi:hypothetical protein
MKREAKHQVAISSYVCLVERQRIPRIGETADYRDDDRLRHYAYTICGTELDIWVTTPQRIQGGYTTYQVERLRQLELSLGANLQEFLSWHRAIVSWGVLEYARSYVEDIESFLGQDRRDSIWKSLRSAKEVTAPVPEGQSDEGSRESGELVDEQIHVAVSHEGVSSTLQQSLKNPAPTGTGRGRKRTAGAELRRSSRTRKKREEAAAEEQTGAGPSRPLPATKLKSGRKRGNRV